MSFEVCFGLRLGYKELTLDIRNRGLVILAEIRFFKLSID